MYIHLCILYIYIYLCIFIFIYVHVCTCTYDTGGPLSILNDVAAAFNLTGVREVCVRKVEREWVGLDLVELSFKDQYITRSDMWRFTCSLVSGGREGERERGRECGREGEREGEREGGRAGGRERGREGGREGRGGRESRKGERGEGTCGGSPAPW